MSLLLSISSILVGHVGGINARLGVALFALLLCLRGLLRLSVLEASVAFGAVNSVLIRYVQVIGGKKSVSFHSYEGQYAELRQKSYWKAGMRPTPSEKGSPWLWPCLASLWFLTWAASLA